MADPLPSLYATWYPDAPQSAPDVETPVSRHSSWRNVRARHLASFPACAACGFTRALHVHHVVPIEIAPELELCAENLLTLGSNCPSGNHHILFGHGQNWRTWVPSSRQLAADMLAAIRTAKVGQTRQ